MSDDAFGCKAYCKWHPAAINTNSKYSTNMSSGHDQQTWWCSEAGRPEQSLLTQDTSADTGRPERRTPGRPERSLLTQDTCFHREAWTKQSLLTQDTSVSTRRPEWSLLTQDNSVDTGHQCFYTTGNKTLTSSGWRHPPILFHSPLHPSSAVLPPSTSSCMLHHPTLRLWSVHRESERAR